MIEIKIPLELWNKLGDKSKKDISKAVEELEKEIKMEDLGLQAARGLATYTYQVYNVSPIGACAASLGNFGFGRTGAYRGNFILSTGRSLLDLYGDAKQVKINEQEKELQELRKLKASIQEIKKFTGTL